MPLTPLDPAIPPNPVSRIGIYGPRELADDFHMAKKRDEIEPVLAKIDKMYKQAKQEAEGGRLDCDYGYGFCLGLLDPATNIRVNDIICNAAAAASPGEVGDVPRRSLDGLVAFLTCLFPYLPDAEAVAYLDAAELDPLVAALIIIDRRGMRQFGFCSGATVAAVETALRCAAVVAEHPNPELLVAGWKSISGLGLMGKVVLRSFPDANDVSLIQTGRGDLDLELTELWELARCRLEHLVPIGRELPPVRAAMKRMLLATIHGFYFKALGSLPSDELTHKYHRGLLLGGYCYGPLDPVENIIVNTVWYEQTFPSSKRFITSMISTSCLWLVAARSMYGLVSFLCTRYPLLTPDLALQRLLVTGANLRIADPNLLSDEPSDEKLDWSKSPQIGSGVDTAFVQRSAVHKMAARATVPEAYAAATAVAFYPNSDAQIQFLASPHCVEELGAISDALLQCVR